MRAGAGQSPSTLPKPGQAWPVPDAHLCPQGTGNSVCSLGTFQLGMRLRLCRENGKGLPKSTLLRHPASQPCPHPGRHLRHCKPTAPSTAPPRPPPQPPPRPRPSGRSGQDLGLQRRAPPLTGVLGEVAEPAEPYCPTPGGAHEGSSAPPHRAGPSRGTDRERQQVARRRRGV